MENNVRNRFYWHEEWDEMINGELTASMPDSVRVEIYRALTRYGCYRDFGEIKLSDTAKGVISGCMRTLNAEWDAYLKQRDINRENGVKGGAPKGNRNARNKQPKTTEWVDSACSPISVSDNDSESDIGIDNGSEKEKESSKRKSEDTDNGCQKFMAWYNEQIKYTDLPKISEMTTRRIRLFSAIKSKYGSQKISEVINMVLDSNYLTERMKPSFDWLFKKDNFIKVMEGQYNN